MSFNLALSSVTAAIAGLTITGVTVRDTDKIAASWQSVSNVLYPNPSQDGFITGFTMAYDLYVDDTLSPVQVSYTLHYRFLGSQIGDMTNFSTAYGGVATKLATIIPAMVGAAMAVADVTIELGEVTIGNKQDPAGNQYHGADFALNIVERYKDA